MATLSSSLYVLRVSAQLCTSARRRLFLCSHFHISHRFRHCFLQYVNSAVKVENGVLSFTNIDTQQPIICDGYAANAQGEIGDPPAPARTEKAPLPQHTYHRGTP